MVNILIYSLLFFSFNKVNASTFKINEYYSINYNYYEDDENEGKEFFVYIQVFFNLRSKPKKVIMSTRKVLDEFILKLDKKPETEDELLNEINTATEKYFAYNDEEINEKLLELKDSFQNSIKSYNSMPLPKLKK